MAHAKRKRGENKPMVPVKAEVPDDDESFAESDMKSKKKKPLPDFVRDQIFVAVQREENFQTFERWMMEYEDFTNVVKNNCSFVGNVIIFDNSSVLGLLCRHGLDLNKLVQSPQGTRIHPLKLASFYGSHKCLQIIGEITGNRRVKSDDFGCNVVHDAVRCYRVSVLKVILSWEESRFLVTERDKSGLSSMDYLSGKFGDQPELKAGTVVGNGIDRINYAVGNGIDRINCAVLLSDFFTEDDVKTAFYPFNQFYRDSPFLNKVNVAELYQSNTTAFRGECPRGRWEMAMEKFVNGGRYEMAACWIMSCNYVSAWTTAYKQCILKGAPADIVRWIETKVIDHQHRQAQAQEQRK
jgi:hypothetical protein